MQTSRIIQEIIGTRIKHLGFEFSINDRATWVYVKQTEELKQEITIRLLSKGRIKLYFSTNAYGQRSIDGASLVKEGEYGGDILGVYNYSNEQEFREILECFNRTILVYGLEALKKISIPTTEIRPTNETNLYLYENHVELNKRYREVLKIDENTTYNEIFSIIQDYITEIQGQEFEKIKTSLIGLAAIAGTVLVGISDGNWVWTPDVNVCWVSNNEKYPKRCCPLVIIIESWRDNTGNVVERLNYYYNYMKKA